MKRIFATNPNLLYASVIVLFSMSARAQETTPGFGRHSIGINIGHLHSFSGVDENGDRKVAVLPYWGLDYNFQISSKFILGLHTDFISESFKVEKNVGGSHKEIVERSFPIAPALMGIYNASHHWSFGFGAGAEFAKEGNYFLNRVGIEYGVELKRGWELLGIVQYDIRWNAYDSWTISLGIAKMFGNTAGSRKQ